MNLFGKNNENEDKNKLYLEEYEKDKQSLTLPLSWKLELLIFISRLSRKGRLKKESLIPPFRPIDKNRGPDEALDKYDELHGYASALSRINAKIYIYSLIALTLIGVAIAFTFLLYDEVELHYLIFICLILVGLLLAVQYNAKRTDCHRKYIEYRILAEATRIQYYLSVKGIEEPVINIMPWFLKEGVKWIKTPLSELPINQVTERKSILDCWIIDQKNYHTEALEKTESKKKTYDALEKILIFATVALYVVASAYEGWLIHPATSQVAFSIDWHVILKILIGLASVGSLLIVSYYGKLSLSEKEDDFKRMIKLYEQAEKDIGGEKGEDIELILELAREFLIENSTWYSYQTKNKPSLVL